MAYPAAKSGFSLEDLTKMGPDEITRKRKIAEALLAQSQGIHPIANPLEGMAQMAQALVGNLKMARLDRAEREGKEGANALFSAGMGMGEFPARPPGGEATNNAPVSKATSNVADGPKGQESYMNVKSGIAETAQALGIDPVDLATAISYETGGTFDPTQGGPTTKWGKHRGLIQFGEPQAAKYGVDWNDPVGSQLGADKAVAKYLREAGVKPGMGLLDIYSAINAGGVGKYDASDAAAGGAPGTVRDKVEKQMAAHRAKAMAMFGGEAAPANVAQAPGAPVQVASLDPAIGIPPGVPAGVNPVPNQAAIGKALIEQGIDPNGPQAQAFASIGAGGGDPVAANGPDLGPGQPGQVKKGPDGKAYQYAETTGMAGAKGAFGWIPVNEAALGGAGAKPALFVPGVSDAGLGVNPIPNATPLPAGVDPKTLMDPAAQVPLPAPPGTPATQAPLPQQQQMAQALIGGQPQDPAATLGAPAIQPGGPDMGTLMNMAGNEFMSPAQQRMIEALTGRRMEREDRAADPAYQMDLEAKRLQLDKLRRGDPSEALDIERKKLELDKLRRGDPSEALDLKLKQLQIDAAQAPDPKKDLEVEKLRLEVEDAKKGGKADYKVVNDRLIKTQGDKVEDVTPNAPNGAPVPAKFDDVSGVRKEIVQLPSYKNLSQAVPIYKSMVETAGRDNKASDLNLVYGLGKIMDPTSVVREGELHMANDTQGMADYLNGIIKGIQGEGRLSPEARAQIMTEAYGRVKAYQDVFATDSEMYRGIAKRSNMNEADVIPNLGEGLSPWAPDPNAIVPSPAGEVAPPAASPDAPRKTKTGVPWSVSP